MSLRTRSAVFLDRDGTVIVDRHYPRDPDEVELLPGAAAAIARLNRAGLPVIVVTNQSGIGRGLLDEARFRAVQARMESLLAREGARIDGVYHCPHAPGEPGCECRKPAPGLFLRAAAEHGLDLASCVFVGDGARDVTPAAQWGATAYLIGPEEADPPPPGVDRVGSLKAAVDRILKAAKR